MAYNKTQLTNIIQTLATQVGKSIDTGSASNNARTYLAAALGDSTAGQGFSMGGIPQWLYDEINKYAKVTNPPYKVITADGKPLTFTPYQEPTPPPPPPPPPPPAAFFVCPPAHRWCRGLPFGQWRRPGLWQRGCRGGAPGDRGPAQRRAAGPRCRLCHWHHWQTARHVL